MNNLNYLDKEIFTAGYKDYIEDANKINKRKYKINLNPSNNINIYNNPFFLNTNKFKDKYNGCILDIDFKSNERINNIVTQMKEQHYPITESENGYKLYCRLTDDEYTIINKYFNNSTVIILFNQEHIDILTNRSNGIDYAINNFILLEDEINTSTGQVYTYKSYNYYKQYNIENLLKNRDDNSLFLQLINEIHSQSISIDCNKPNKESIKESNIDKDEFNDNNLDETTKKYLIDKFNYFIALEKHKDKPIQNKYCKVDNIEYVWYWLFRDKFDKDISDRFTTRIFIYTKMIQKMNIRKITTNGIVLYGKMFLKYNPYLTPKEKKQELERFIEYIANKTMPKVRYDEYNEDFLKLLDFFPHTGYVLNPITDRWEYKYNTLNGKVYSYEEMDLIKPIEYIQFIKEHYINELKNGEFNSIIYNKVEKQEYKPIRNQPARLLDYKVLKDIFKKDLIKDKISQTEKALKLCRVRELNPGYNISIVFNNTSIKLLKVNNSKSKEVLITYDMNEIKKDLNKSFKLIQKFIKSNYKLEKSIKL